MPQIKYHCWFDTWEGFMDGQLIIGDLHFNYDFVSSDTVEPDDTDPILVDFSEEGARQHFAAHGINNVTFIYDNKE